MSVNNRVKEALELMASKVLEDIMTAEAKNIFAYGCSVTMVCNNLNGEPVIKDVTKEYVELREANNGTVKR